MWLCVQGLKLGASSVGTNFSHSVRSHHCLSQALSSSPQQAGGVSGRRHRDLVVTIAGGGGGGGHGGRLKVAGLPPACILRVDMASQRRYCNRGSRRVLARCVGDSGRGGNEAQSPPQEAVLKAITEVSKAEGRVAQTTNMVLGGTVSEDTPDEWNIIDQKVNVYPMVRGFTAIGIGGDDFVQAMVGAVESVIETQIPEGGVSQKLSARGKYVSVKIGPVTVNSSDQVRAVYDAMKRDVRMKYFL
jgi:putative lipoic acid-binding regulatory protein